MATTTTAAQRGNVLRVAVVAFAFIGQPVCGTDPALVKSEAERRYVFAASGYTS